MEDKDIINLWKAQDVKIEQSLAINKQLLKEVISQKAESALQSLIKFKARGIAIAIIYLILLGSILSFAVLNYSSAANYFIVSIGAIFLINVKALYDYIKHMVLASKINYDENITETQQKLSLIQSSILKHIRIMVLQFPLWTTFYLSNKWFPQNVGWGYIIFQFIMTGSFTFLAYWLYKNLTLDNLDKKVIKILIEGSGGKSVMKAKEFYLEIEKYK